MRAATKHRATVALPPSPRVGVVVLTYGTNGRVANTLRILFEDGVDPSAVLLVQNPKGRDDPTVEAPYPGVEVFRMPTNAGYGAAMNVGMRTLRRRSVDVFLLLTHDVRLRPGVLNLMLSSAASGDYGILGPALVRSGGAEPWSFGGLNKGGVTEHLTRQQPVDSNGVSRCDWVDGAVMLMSATVVERVGFFEERFFLYFEESSYCLRASRAGVRIGVVPAAVVEQSPGGHSRPGAYTYLMSRNGLRYSREAGGVMGSVRYLLVLARTTVSLLRACLGPRSSWRTRHEGYLGMIGLLSGVAAYSFRRWGPPPRWLPGLGDVHV